MKELMCGVGYNSRGKHKVKVNGSNTAAYSAWQAMIRRCYSLSQKARPTYINCYVCDEWFDFQIFSEWYVNQEHSNLGYQLDKDVISVNNKMYSPDTCCLIPRELNILFTNSGATRGNYPQGVSFYKSRNKYRAMLRVDGKNKHLGHFSCPQQAHQAYVVAKEANVKRMALEWKDRITTEVFDALMNWELNTELELQKEPTDRFAMGTPSVDHAGENKEGDL